VALRTALDSKSKIQDVREEHALGAVLVAAIFDGFYTTYERRTADLIRIATGGTGVLPQGALHPDLIARLTGECVRTAQSVLTMCIRTDPGRCLEIVGVRPNGGRQRYFSR
jgi:hypothetical protein